MTCPRGEREVAGVVAPPYGYTWNADKSGYVLDPEAVPTVRFIFEATIGGATLGGVCAMLEASGIPAAAQMAARAVAPVAAGLLVTWLGGYAPMLAVLVAIAVAATLAMGMFALSARPLRLDGPAEGHASVSAPL